jgi:hypothetical protein
MFRSAAQGDSAFRPDQFIIRYCQLKKVAKEGNDVQILSTVGFRKIISFKMGIKKYTML